jgi:hypothetical protein
MLSGIEKDMGCRSAKDIHRQNGDMTGQKKDPR